MSNHRQAHRSATRMMSIAMVVIGVVLLVRTLVAGGAPTAIGIVLGLLFVLAGAARLYLQSRAS